METSINDEDMEHLRAFPDSRKAAVMEKIMALVPAESVELEGDEHFETTVLKLRRDGYGLIDLQRQETAFTAVWYRKGNALLGLAGAEVAMLMWEARACGGATTLMTWRV
jgi:hypothetical protein